MDDHQNKVRHALEGGERVYWHTKHNKIAVWYGYSEVWVFGTKTWEKLDSIVVPSHEQGVEMKLSSEGYDRLGRCEKTHFLQEYEE